MGRVYQFFSWYDKVKEPWRFLLLLTFVVVAVDPRVQPWGLLSIFGLIGLRMIYLKKKRKQNGN